MSNPAMTSQNASFETGRWERVSRYIPAFLLSAVLLLLILPPIVVLIRTSLIGADGETFTFSNYIDLGRNPKLYVSAFNSVTFALLASMLSLFNGGIVAWLVERTNVPLKPVAYLSAIISLGTPYIVTVMAWLYLLGRAGPLNATYRALTGETANLFNVYSLTGMILIEGFLWSPFVFLLMSATFRRSNADMEEAARMSGASVFATISRISMRLAFPAILGLGLFVFIRNIEAFDVPVLIGTPSNISLLTSDMYFEMTKMPPHLGYSSAFAVVMMVVVAGLLYMYRRVSQNAERFASITGKGFRPRPFDLGRLKWLGAALIVLNALLVLIFPLVAIVYSSLTPFTRSINWAGLSNLTLSNYAGIFGHFHYVGQALNTIAVSAVSATVVISLTSVAAWMSVRRVPGSGLLDQLSSLPLIFPGVVLGVAVLEVSLYSALPIYGTLWAIGLAFTIRYLPYGMRYAHSGVIQVHRELEEAASMSGASKQTLLRRIVVPLISPSLIAGWLFVFLLGAKELSIAVLLAGSNSKTISVSMFDQWINGSAGLVSAMGVAWAAVMTIFSGLLYYITRSRAEF